jgi:hypothetical protein
MNGVNRCVRCAGTFGEKSSASASAMGGHAALSVSQVLHEWQHAAALQTDQSLFRFFSRIMHRSSPEHSTDASRLSLRCNYYERPNSTLDLSCTTTAPRVVETWHPRVSVDRGEVHGSASPTAIINVADIPPASHIGQIAAADFFVVPTATCRLLFVW